MFYVQKWVLPEYGSLGKSLYEMKPSKSWLWSKNLCLFNHMLMNDLDLIYDNEEKKRNTALNLIDDCIFFGWNSCTYLLHTLLFCMANATKKKKLMQALN